MKMIDINEVKFDKDGLVPAIVVDFYTREVLTLAYMNRESLEITRGAPASFRVRDRNSGAKARKAETFSTLWR